MDAEVFEKDVVRFFSVLETVLMFFVLARMYVISKGVSDGDEADFYRALVSTYFKKVTECTQERNTTHYLGPPKVQYSTLDGNGTVVRNTSRY